MENKYYTPEIEEFYVGFEYEQEDINEGGSSLSWYKHKIENGLDIDQLEKNEEHGLSYRVKHLDREDIEECGAEFQFIESLDFLPPIVSEHFQLGVITIIFKDNNICIHKNYGLLFQGTIKNKSELKILMKQLGI